MKGPLFWKIFLSFLLTAVLINQSTWIIYLAWWDPGPSWERTQSEQMAPVQLASARTIIEGQGLEGFRRWQSALPAAHRGRVKVDNSATPPDSRDARTMPAVAPDGARLTLVYKLDGSAERRWDLRRILYRSMDYLVASLLGGILFAAALAWYLTQPIRRVRSGFEALAAGDLDTRLAPAVGRRRDEFADLARDFDRMAERLQQLIAMRDQLLHDVSHELRSPLARMNLAIALQRQAPGPAGPSLERIAAEVKRLDELVGELLSLARADSGVHDEESYFDLAGLVDAVASNARFEAQANDVEVRTRHEIQGAIVRGSAELMRRALENVLRNAIRVSGPGDVVTVSVSEGPPGRLAVVATDQGPGVPPEMIEAMFDPFVRVDGSPKAAGGYGLGLAIVRRAVAALGGTVRAKNLAPHGLAVTIDIPRAVVEPPEEA